MPTIHQTLMRIDTLENVADIRQTTDGEFDTRVWVDVVQLKRLPLDVLYKVGDQLVKCANELDAVVQHIVDTRSGVVEKDSE